MIILKFSPYFPPHKWWLESHIEERSQWWIKKKYGKVINITTPMWQENAIKEYPTISYKSKIIWYKKDWYEIVILDAFDLIPVFPFPKFRSKNFWITINYLKQSCKWYNKKDIIVNTHTRFFLTSLLWWIFAKRYWFKRIHIEHWVDFVKLASKFKTTIAWIFDQTIGRRIFKNSNTTIGISWWCQRFVNKFTKKQIPIIHRWMNFTNMIKTNTKSKKTINQITLWFVWRLVKLKWLDLLISAFDNIEKKIPNLKLEIIWDWDEKEKLEEMVSSLSLEKKIIFLGFKDRDFIANKFLPNIDIIVNPSYQEWLPTSVLEGLLSKCVVVATDVWWTNEISNKEDLILVKPGNIKNLQRWLEYAIENYKQSKWLSYKHIKDHFNWNKNIKKYYEIYTKI